MKCEKCIHWCHIKPLTGLAYWECVQTAYRKANVITCIYNPRLKDCFESNKDKASANKRIELLMMRHQIELEENWDDILKKIPFVHFKEHWDVKVIPPYRGALARFTIEHGKYFVSVYLDWFNRLGYGIDVGNPYWEVYTRSEEDPNRFRLNETKEMMHYIANYLESGQASFPKEETISYD